RLCRERAGPVATPFPSIDTDAADGVDVGCAIVAVMPEDARLEEDTHWSLRRESGVAGKALECRAQLARERWSDERVRRRGLDSVRATGRHRQAWRIGLTG